MAPHMTSTSFYGHQCITESRSQLLFFQWLDLSIQVRQLAYSENKTERNRECKVAEKIFLTFRRIKD